MLANSFDVEACAADERTVDVRLAHEAGDVRRLDGAAVKDARCFGHVRRPSTPTSTARSCAATCSACSGVAACPEPIAQTGS